MQHVAVESYQRSCVWAWREVVPGKLLDVLHDVALEAVLDGTLDDALGELLDVVHDVALEAVLDGPLDVAHGGRPDVVPCVVLDERLVVVPLGN